MKKILHLLILLSSGFSMLTMAQTIVNTSPQNKKIVLEEFTGLHCQYCPDGHARAKAIKDANPGNAFLVNIHVGSFATPGPGEPDYRTPFGTAIAGQSLLTGYPAGTINRFVFPNRSPMTTGGTALGRSSWLGAANEIKAIPSYVNVAATATIDATTRLLTVHVETYYTANSPIATNKLNVVLNQNNTFGPQTAGNAGNNYNHQHRLVHMLTGQWGDAITVTTAGTFVDRTYTYTIPAAYNSVAAEMGNFEVITYVSEGNQNIITGNEAVLSYTGLLVNDAKVYEVKPIIAQCLSTIAPIITIQNNGQTSLTSLPISYNINSGPNQTYNWTGNLASFEKTTITIPSVSYSLLANNTFNVNIPVDGNTTNNTGAASFLKAKEGTNNVTLSFTPDAYGSEISWNIQNSLGTILSSGGPYVDGDTTPINVSVSLPTLDCYTLNMVDAYGDGIGTGSNTVTLKDSNNLILFSNNGLYGSGIDGNFSATSLLANNTFETSSNVKLYPNPSTGIVKISIENDVQVKVIDILGKIVYTNNSVTNESNLDLSNLQKGIYLVKIIGENVYATEKLILK